MAVALTDNALALMQAIFQKASHSGVSKTVNPPTNATSEDIAAVDGLAYGRTTPQTLSPSPEGERCPECGATVRHTGGCSACRECGGSVCDG